MVAVVLSVMAFSRHMAPGNVSRFAPVLIVIAVTIAMAVAVLPVLERFIGINPMDDDRWTPFVNTLVAIEQFCPVGSGLGTFPDVYRSFQPVDRLLFINHAHNDYLELLLEMGVAGALIICGLLFLFLRGWMQLRR